jgi:predicted ATP-grasp superfamily ATP-dependent carboligase/cation diffusion facilitator CzcD-associated flavoprotein CzcO
MPVGMFLRSNWTATQIADPNDRLTLEAYQAASGKHFSTPVPLNQFVQYGLWYQRQAVPEVDLRSVSRAETHPEGFRLTLQDGEALSSHRLIIAAGIGSFARRPPEFQGLPATLVSHTSEHRDLKKFAGKRVLVVGTGQSALESGALLHEVGATTEIVGRAQRIHWLQGWLSKTLHHRLGDFTRRLLYAPTDVGPAGISQLMARPDVLRRLPRSVHEQLRKRSVRPAGARWLVARLQEVPISLGRFVASVIESGERVSVKLDDGSERTVDHVLLGTGYRVDVARYNFLSPRLVQLIQRCNGYPVLREGLETSVPGLHVVGAPAVWSFGPLMQFVSGARYASRALFNSIARNSRGPARTSHLNRSSRRSAAVSRKSAERSGERVGAVVIGGDYQGLGIVRSLGRRKVPVCVIDDERSITRFSRYTTHAVSTASLRDEKQMADTVLEIGHRLSLKGWVLYPTRDEMVAGVARHRSRLAEFYRVPTPDWDTIQWVWDKRNTYRLADELGIPTPRTCYPRNLDDLEAIELRPPYVVKPAIKEHFFYATKAKAWRANSRSELREVFQRAAALVGPGETMVQELIPGDGRQQFAYCAFFKTGRALGSMVVRRSRQHPPDFGRASTFVETIDLSPLELLSERFLRAIDYYGLVELEYKLDPQDGEYKLLDVNGRTWGYHTLGSGAGVDFPYMQFADQMGESVEPCRGRSGISWIRLITDIPTAILEISRGHQHWRSYLASLAGVNMESVFSREDPLPGFAELALLPYLSRRRSL